MIHCTKTQGTIDMPKGPAAYAKGIEPKIKTYGGLGKNDPGNSLRHLEGQRPPSPVESQRLHYNMATEGLK